ncbi:MAG: ABC transporter permease [Actinomycetia bacterium]|nr:ABC transporter permease [Actinomycetes bacterium]
MASPSTSSARAGDSDEDNRRSHPDARNTYGRREPGRRLRILARKEFTDALPNRLVVVALVLLLALTLIAVGLGAASVHTKLAEYNQTVALLKSLGRTEIPPMPSLNPIAVSKNFINYLAMVGALLAMVLGFTTVRKEREGGTLGHILSRPVYRDQLLTGKILGNAAILGVLMIAVGAVTALALALVGGVPLTLVQIDKLAFTMVMSWLYMLVFFLLAMFFSLWLPKGNQALLLTIIVWLVFAFIFPQIGDTMDLDNQLPGGFFATLGMNKTQETAALLQFKWYEKLRDGVEELSPTKHYERISFALLGIKTEFANTKPAEIIRLKAVNVVGLLVPIVLLIGGSYVVFLRQES